MDFHTALEQVYRVFATKRPPQTIDACDCCVSQDEVKVLLKTPLRQLTASQLSGYAASVFLTVGSESDFRYFLPRILEISCQEKHWWPDLEVALRKLALAGWMNWHSEEIAVLHTFFELAFDRALQSEESPDSEIDSWICGLALAGVNVTPFLRKLENPELIHLLIAYFEGNSAQLERGKLRNAFWNGEEASAAPVIDWFQSAPIQAAIWKYYGL